MCGGKKDDGGDTEVADMEDDAPNDGGSGGGGSGRVEKCQCCSRFLRTLLFIINFIIWLGSCGLLALGIFLIVDNPFSRTIIDGNMIVYGAVVLIGVGAIGFFISFIGCCGPLVKSKCLILTYVIVLIILLAALLIGGVFIYLFTSRLDDAAASAMEKSLSLYNNNANTSLEQSWDFMQRTLSCCGVLTYKDWATYNTDFQNVQKIPASCCINNQGTINLLACQTATDQSQFYSGSGCMDKLVRILQSKSPIIGLVGAGVALFMVLGIIFGLILFINL